MSSAPRPGTPGTFDLRPFEMWERFLLDGAHVGFLHRHMDDAGVLTTRTAFEPTPAVRAEAPELPEKFMSQCQIQFSADGATWQWLHYEDSSLRQRVTIDRERADLGAEVVPSYADALLALAVARSGAELEFTRLEESSPLQGGVRAPLARMTPRPITVQIPGEIAEPGDAAASAEAAASGTEERAATNEHGDTPEQPAPESWQVDLSLHGQAIGAHVITEGRLRASDYGAGASTLPAASQQQALDGLSADLQTFANLPR